MVKKQFENSNLVWQKRKRAVNNAYIELIGYDETLENEGYKPSKDPYRDELQARVETTEKIFYSTPNPE